MKKESIAVASVLSAISVLMLCILIIIKLPPAQESVTKSDSSDSTANQQNFEQQPETMQTVSESETIETAVLDLQSEPEIILSEEELTQQKIEESIKKMTLEQKVGQMFFCAFRRDNDNNGIIKIDDDIKKTIRDYNIGGVVLFSENIQNSEQVTDYIRDLQNESGIALFIGIDEEGGRVLRTGMLDVPRIPSALSIGKTADAQNTYNHAKTIADYLTPLGFNVDFAPVADVFTNPANTVIGDRAFSTEPDTAAAMVGNFTKGLLDNGVLPSIKHFPGHGDTGEDSHYGIATTKKTLEELSKCEFIPFKAGIGAKSPFVMVGHITTPNIGDNNLPALFNKFLLRDVLRGTLNFNGIIITDSLAMGAITRYYTSEETAVKAIIAGIDMLLMPEDFNRAYNGVINAVKSGEIPEERIDESVKRILTVKYDAGLLDLS